MGEVCAGDSVDLEAQTDSGDVPHIVTH